MLTMQNAYAVPAYATKALKELHESQVIAGKGAGRSAGRTHLNKITKLGKRREAVGLPCHPGP